MTRFVSIDVRVPDAERAERVVVEAMGVGATGCEESTDLDLAGTRIRIYAPADRAEAIVRTLHRVFGSAIDLGPTAAVPDIDWSSAWRAGLAAIEVSPRLCVTPDAGGVTPRSGRLVLEIEPRQAFGTGGHESTRLALEWVDALVPGSLPEGTALDVGSGSGVLAMAAVGLGAGRAIGFDLDPVAAREAGGHVRRNGLWGRVALFAGELSALDPAFRAGLVVANLLRREMEPILAALCARVAPGGWLVLSGLLESEAPAIEAGLEAAGFHDRRTRTRDDASAVRWLALAAQAPTDGAGARV